MKLDVAGWSERNSPEGGLEHNTELLPMLTATIADAWDHAIIHGANVRSSWIACHTCKRIGLHRYLAAAVLLDCREACGGDVEPRAASFAEKLSICWQNTDCDMP